MKKILVALTALICTPVISQTIECQILKEQILNEVRQQQAQQNPSPQVNQGNLMNPSLGPLYAQAEQQGRLIGGGIVAGLNALNGQPATLQDRINLYKQKCE